MMSPKDSLDTGARTIAGCLGVVVVVILVLILVVAFASLGAYFTYLSVTYFLAGDTFWGSLYGGVAALILLVGPSQGGKRNG